MINRIESFAVSAVLIALSVAEAAAQAYPSRPIRLVVPFAAGGGVDAVGRTVAQKLSEGLGQPIVIDNRGGAGGNVGTEAVARSAPDGHTLLITTHGHTIQPHLQKLSWDPLASFAPISMVGTFYFIFIVNPAVPATTPRELIAYAKANPGKLAYGSSGLGGPMHLGMEMLKNLAGIDIMHVPYKGNGPMTAALLANEVQVTMDSMAVSLPHVRAGKLRGLATSGPRRAVQAPDLPTMTEAGVQGFEYVGWHGILAAAATPREIVARLNAELVKALGAAEVRERLLALGYDAAPTAPGEFAAVIAADIAKYGKVVREGGIKID